MSAGRPASEDGHNTLGLGKLKGNRSARVVAAAYVLCCFLLIFILLSLVRFAAIGLHGFPGS